MVRNRTAWPLRATAWCFGLVLGVPTAVSAVLRATAVVGGHVTLGQFWHQTVANFTWHVAVTVTVFAVAWLVVRSSASYGMYARMLVVLVGSLLLTWSWLVQTADTPLAGVLNAPVWLGWALLGMNVVIMWRWCALLVGAFTPPELRRP